MGMFDYVKYKANCWKCGFELTNWQSKSSSCELNNLSVKEVNNFYASCRKCNAWNEYDVIPKEIEIIFNEKKSKLST